LLTGAQGFIGTWIVKQLVQLKHIYKSQHQKTLKIFATDVKPDANIFSQVCSDEEMSHVELKYGDVSDSKFADELIEHAKPTRIIHLAGLQVPTCRADPVRGALVNVIGTLNVFNAAVAYNKKYQSTDSPKPIKNIIYASSAAACGSPDDYDGIVNDDDLHRPNTHYGVFKQCNEGNARIYWQDNGLASVGLRPLTVFGVGREIGLTSGPTKAIKAAILDRNYTIQFNGMTSFNDVRDVAHLFITCALRCQTGAHACNIKGTPASVHDFVSEVESVMPSAKGKIIIADNAQPLPFPHLFDESSLESLIGPVPVTPLTQSIDFLVKHFQALHSKGLLHDRDLL